MSTVSLGRRVNCVLSGRDAGRFEGRQHAGERVGLGDHFVLVAVDAHVVGAGFEGELHEGVFLDLVAGDARDALAVEHPGDAAGGAELAAGELEDLADFGGRAVAVVGVDLAQHGDARRAVAFVQDLLEIAAFELAGALLDRPLDRVLGHAARLWRR